MFKLLDKLELTIHLCSQAGVKAVCLHGCVGRNCKKVWPPDDKTDRCELCGTARYDANGKPREYVIYFPLRDRIKSLLRCRQYTDLLQWEWKRTKNPDYVTGSSQYCHCVFCNTHKNTNSLIFQHFVDVYDCSWWIGGIPSVVASRSQVVGRNF